MLRGTTVYLTPIDAENAELYRSWINDPSVHAWMLAGHIPITRMAERDFCEQAEKSYAEGSAYHFEICMAEDDRPIGVCGLDHVSALHRHAEIGVFIGVPAEWGKGHGRDAIRTLLTFGFEALGLHSMRICVYPENERALELYRSLGFTEVGRDREAWFINGAFRDMVRLDMLEDEYRERYG